MASKRITISLTEEQYEQVRNILPEEVDKTGVVADLIGLFIDITIRYNDDFLDTVFPES